MVSFDAVVKNRLGIHARVVALLINIINKYDANAYIIYNDTKVNIKNLIDVLALSITQGSIIHIEVEGEDSTKCSSELLELVKNNFGEKS